jgi:hypothetical protein
VGSALSTIGKGLSFDLNLELGIIVGMIDTSPWRNRDSPFGNSFTINERIIRIGLLFIFLGRGASLHLQLSIMGKVIVLLVLQISCSDRCIIHFLLGEFILAHLDGNLVSVSPRLDELNSIHN